MDETAIAAENSKLSVVVPIDANRVPKRTQGTFSHHMTLIMCSSADGDTPPRPSVILPLQTLPELPESVIKHFNWAGSETGWFTCEIWTQWIELVFIPYVKTKRQHTIFTGPQFGRCILFLDSHPSRLAPYALQLLHDNGIIPFTIPAHSSHILQPLDCGVHCRLKRSIKQSIANKVIRYDQGLPGYRRSCLRAVIGAIHDSHNLLVVEEAWARSGLWPWNPLRVLECSEKVTSSLEVTPRPARPTAVQVISGYLVTPDMVISHRLKVADEKLKKASEKATASASKKAAVQASRTLKRSGPIKHKIAKVRKAPEPPVSQPLSDDTTPSTPVPSSPFPQPQFQRSPISSPPPVKKRRVSNKPKSLDDFDLQ